MGYTIDKERCPQNHHCPLVEKCPVEAISQNGYGLPVINQAECIECGVCYENCGMNAVIEIQ